MSMSDAQGFRLENQYSLEKNVKMFMLFETPV